MNLTKYIERFSSPHLKAIDIQMILKINLLVETAFKILFPQGGVTEEGTIKYFKIPNQTH